MQRPSLSPLKGKVAADILACQDIGTATSRRKVAQKSVVSRAMVVKVAKKPGPVGFGKFRLGLVGDNNSDTAALPAEIPETDTAGEIVLKVFRTAMQALEEAFEVLDLAAFDRAADYPAPARQRDFYRFGRSAQIARDVSHNLQRIGIRTPVFDDAHRMMSAAHLGPDDLAVLVSHPGATAAVLEAAEMARHKGARTIAVTNHPESPLARVVDVDLSSTAQNSPLLGENAPARIARLNLLDALFVAVAQPDRRAADENLRRAMRAVQCKRRL